MIHRRIDLLRKLMTLSRIHLQLVLEEKWEDWETLARQKEDLYGQLMAFKGPSIDPEEREIVDAIRETEKRTLEELSHRRNEARKELAEMDRFTGRIKNYRHSCHESSDRHFSIKI
jgi:hypothetical protein